MKTFDPQAVMRVWVRGGTECGRAPHQDQYDAYYRIADGNDRSGDLRAAERRGVGTRY